MASPAAEEEKPAPRRPWRRRLLKIAVGVVVFLLVAPLLIALPPVRGLVAGRIGAVLDRKVDIGGASAWWFSGIDLEDVTVHSPAGFDGPLARVRKIHVDVDVLGLVGGSLEARVRIVEPHVTLRRDAQGRRNTEGLMAGDEEEESASDGGGSDVQIVVIGGRLESVGGAEEDASLEDLELEMALRPDGRLAVEVKGLAARAAVGGGNARLRVKADLDRDRRGPFEVDVPPLDLSRLARLAADASGVHDLAGTVTLTGRGTLHDDGTLSGSLTADLADLHAAAAGGAAVSLRRLHAVATLESEAGGTTTEARVDAGDLRVTEAGREVYREPTLTLTGTTRYHPDGLLRVEAATVDLGGTLRVVIDEPLLVQVEPELRFTGKLRLDADLGRLGSLRALAPALEPLGGGRLVAAIEGTGDRGLEVGAGVGVRDLRILPCDLAPDGYAEPSVQLAFRASHAAERGSTLQVTHLASALASLTMPPGQQALSLGVDAQDRAWIDGSFDLRVDLGAVSRLLGARMGVPRGEQLAGTVSLTGTGSGTADTMRVDAQLRADAVRFPPSWARVDRPASLTAQVQARTQGAETSVRLERVAGMGLTGSLEAALRRADDTTTGLHRVDGQLGLDLAQARGWLAGLLGLDPGATLGGKVDATVRLAEQGAGRRFVTTTQLSDLVWIARPGAAAVREPRVTLRANVLLAEAGGRSELEELKLASGGLTVDGSGSSFVAGEEKDVDVVLRLSGDAARLAPTLAAALGAGYEDLRGKGALGGTVTVRGSPSQRGRSLVVDGDLVLASWSTSGLQVGDAKATLSRPDEASPLGMGFVCALNGGRAFAEAQAQLGGESMPWSAKADLTGVDTSGIVTSKGVGRYLRFALPALLPSAAATPVLSGRLDAHVEARAGDTRDFAGRPDFEGRGRVSMAEGEIRQSTLFGNAGGSTLGTLLTGLKVAVPEVGAILEEAARAVAFTDLKSDFAMRGRRITVERTLLTGPRLVVDMKGVIQGNADGSRYALDLPTKIVLQGGAGRALAKYLPDGTIPMKVRGTLSEPQATPDVDATDLLGGALPAKPKDLIEDIKKKLPKPPKLPNPFK